MEVAYTLEVDDIASARLLALGIRPRIEFLIFAAAIAMLLAWSVSPWSFGSLPLLIGLTASLGAFRLMQIGKVRETALAAFERNPTLRRLTAASWDDRGVTIRPANAPSEFVAWTDLLRFRENERVLVLLQKTGMMHAIPKRAFIDRAKLDAFRRAARRPEG
jgi:hypothetical protein